MNVVLRQNKHAPNIQKHQMENKKHTFLTDDSSQNLGPQKDSHKILKISQMLSQN